MSRKERDLSPEEAALWARVAETVTPISGNGRVAKVAERVAPPVRVTAPPRATPPAQRVAHVRAPASAPDRHGLDSSWDRKLARGTVQPDFTLDLHGCSLDAAHSRLIHGLAQARAMGARVVLLVTGKPRPVDAADRGHKRGAIRAKVIDWLAHSEHGPGIAAVRNAHRRHGGQGALYIILKRQKA